MEYIHNIIWGELGLSFLLLVSLYFSFTLKFKHLRCLPAFFKRLLSKKKQSSSNEMSQLQILTTSLGAVMGIGNLVGVGSSIIAGGPGALFWMFVSSILVSILKYAEILLTGILRYKEGNNYIGGVIYYMKACFKTNIISKIYVVLLLVVSVLMGNMIVANAIATSIHTITKLPLVISGILISLGVGFIIFKGLKSVISMNAHLVPYMILIYFIVCIYILIISIDQLPQLFSLIMNDAFNSSSIQGGLIGSAMKYGVSRGIYSNEAGMGTCTLAHGKSNEDPKYQAMFGVLEVIIDSLLMCTLSGAVLLLANISNVSDPTIYLIESFKVFMPLFGEGFVLLSLILFGVSSILGWYFYGVECVKYLSKKHIYRHMYSLLYIAFLLIGSCINAYNLWLYADIINGMLLLLNVITLILMRKYIINY